MSIIGIGLDLVKISRIKEIYTSSRKIAKKILSFNEYQRYQMNNFPIEFIAKHFSVKEAASKALGTGIKEGIYFNQFELFHDFFGKPKLNLLGKARSISKQLKIKKIHVSISDEKKYVCSIVIFEN
ncbi:MAG: holo-ACP synthase [Arsenophonus sp.]|nr:MAG: holo-ACP synthase [Arsenophonus sp.]